MLKLASRVLLTIAVSISLAGCPAPPPEWPPAAETEPRLHTLAEITHDQFLELCSGLKDTSESVRVISYANCLGRVRGFVDSHQLTVKLNENKGVTPMWCVDSKLTDEQVFNAIIVWAVDNPQMFQETIASLDSLNAASAVIIRSMHTMFPCGGTK